jgi:uncharacterized protein (DUF2062 family)
MEELSTERAEVHQSSKSTLKQKIRTYIAHIKTLQGDPHYVAKGMAIGVFVGITPTLPFHTVIALALAFIVRGSKPAAVIGVWAGNPFTIPFFYLGSYKLGTFLLNAPTPFDPKYESLSELAKLGLEATLAMMAGGVIIGIPFGIAAYFITLKTFKTIRSRKKKHI